MATKYVSSLTGEEMDAALIDMAYHNSEAYAVGTRNGVAVGSSDVTYHNNSKYWAEQVYGYTDRAEDAANRAEAAVPSGTAGAVFFDRAQTLTTAQQAQARANIAAGGSNRNLLDNPWFTIHQMGTSGHTGVGYGVDRWKIRAGTGCTVTPRTNYGITVSYTTAFDITYCFWIPPAMLARKTYTLSMMIGGQVISATGVIGTGNQYYFGISDDTNHIRARVGALSTIGSGNLIINIEPLNSSGTINIDAVKLEVGSVSTLLNDAPPDYGTELAKCQRYFVRFKGIYANVGFGVSTSTTLGYLLIPTPVPMRNAPNTVTVSYSEMYLFANSGYAHAVNSITVQNGGYSSNAAGLTASVASSGLVAGEPLLLQPRASGGYLDISADL